MNELERQLREMQAQLTADQEFYRAQMEQYNRKPGDWMKMAAFAFGVESGLAFAEMKLQRILDMLEVKMSA